MISFLIETLKLLAAFLPFLSLVALSAKANLKRPLRSRQFVMPVLALIYCVVLMFFLDQVASLLTAFLGLIPNWINRLAQWLGGLMDGQLSPAAGFLTMLSSRFEELLQRLNLGYWMLVIANTAMMLVYITFKRIVTATVKAVFKPGNAVYETVAGLFYEYDEPQKQWCVKPHFGQARTYLKTFYIAVVILSMGASFFAAGLYRSSLLLQPFYPAFPIILVGELYFYLNGLTKEEMEGSLSGEEDQSKSVTNFVMLRKVLRKLFKDKLVAENTTVSNDLGNSVSNDELLTAMERSGDPRTEAYALYMRRRLSAGYLIDQNYLHSGLDLLNGKSILFNNPFYYDLIPYAFYAVDRTLLRHKKVLIILGRHGTEEDITAWCEEGLRSISNVPGMWKIGVLSDQEQNLDVGIVTRSNVHNLELHQKNREFFRSVEFVVLIEPSRLITTAQIGLNSLIHECTVPGKNITYCSTDKNCDGLVDALSHILMISLQEVSATSRHSGTNSYMCWGADTEYLQHRMLPNLSRYLGVGTELSFAALKNQVSVARWYGGDAFPVTDMHWIVRQYYYDLLHYAELPINQKAIDEHFVTSPNLWNERSRKASYLTIEDEACNMFEVKREFSTRASEQSFINVISPEYLLRDYMAENDGIFNADAKAIPYIVADYARTKRNVMLRLCLRMSSGELKKDELERELMLVDVNSDELVTALWHEICDCFRPVGAQPQKVDGTEVLCRTVNGRQFVFEQSTITMRRKYSMDSGRMEELYSIKNLNFRRVLLNDLENASYIAEEEDGKGYYLGSELEGHIFQRYLPGQFFVFNGKYYEMLSVASDGQVLVRRAADHITGRPSYRQVREYTIQSVVDSKVMGACQNIGGMRVTRQFADFSVRTPAYWQMPVYNDFDRARKVFISDIPDRQYYNKQILRIDFPEMDDECFTDEIRYTITLLFNELFRTLFAENQPYIAAVTQGPVTEPITYSLAGENGFTPEKNAIYLIEDSQLDIGLLVAAERNLNRIFAIIYDYLGWHFEALDASLNPPPKPVEPEYELAEPEKKSWWKRLKEKVGGFFRKLFRRKPKETAPKEEEAVKDTPQEIPADAEIQPETVDGNNEAAEHIAEEREEETAPETEDRAESEDEAESEDKSESEGEPESEGESVFEDEIKSGNGSDSSEELEDDSRESEEDEEPKDTPMSEDESIPEDDSESEDGPESEGEPEDESEKKLAIPENTAVDSDDQPEIRMSFDTFRPIPVGDIPEDQGDSAQETAETVEEIENEAAAENVPDSASAEIGGEEQETQEVSEQEEVPEQEGSLEFEPDQAKKAKKFGMPLERPPYHERYYLLYGSGSLPQNISPRETFEFLKGLGYDNNFLQQVREGKNVAELVERNYVPGDPNTHYCDFCGVELIGTEYEVLADGRERCLNCGKSAIRTEEEFKDVYRKALKDLDTFFGASITVPIAVKMVNAKRLHKSLGKSFVPTGKSDPRVLGVAIRDKKKGYTILVENGAPRLASLKTIVHELTHIWQYENWDAKEIRSKYGSAQELEVYEGMAKWVEVQYTYLIGEPAAAKREEMNTRTRDDEYGKGFNKYVSKYPLSTEVYLVGDTPFTDVHKPL
ncbi:MAG: hypothetical protein J1E06_11675 [Acutalibacter sp.]|nr:hypothetical protein [Acutalibacter sp.]